MGDMMGKKVVSNERIAKLFKTEKGYLHDEISEGWWLDEGVRNYEFTDNIFDAYEFYNDNDNDDVPKYIGVTHDDEEVETREQMCKVLNGKFVVVKFKTVTTTLWEESE